MTVTFPNFCPIPLLTQDNQRRPNMPLKAIKQDAQLAVGLPTASPGPETPAGHT